MDLCTQTPSVQRFDAGVRRAVIRIHIIMPAVDLFSVAILTDPKGAEPFRRVAGWQRLGAGDERRRL